MKNCKPFYESQTTSWLKETIEPLEQKKKFSEKEITTGTEKEIFRKRNYKYEILNHLYFGPSFVFWMTALGRLSQCFFSNFSSSVKHGD